MLLNINNLSSFAESYSSGYRRRAKKRRSAFYESAKIALIEKCLAMEDRSITTKNLINTIARGESFGEGVKKFFNSIGEFIKKLIRAIVDKAKAFWNWLTGKKSGSGDKASDFFGKAPSNKDHQIEDTDLKNKVLKTLREAITNSDTDDKTSSDDMKKNYEGEMEKSTEMMKKLAEQINSLTDAYGDSAKMDAIKDTADALRDTNALSKRAVTAVGYANVGNKDQGADVFKDPGDFTDLKDEFTNKHTEEGAKLKFSKDDYKKVEKWLKNSKSGFEKAKKTVEKMIEAGNKLYKAFDGLLAKVSKSMEGENGDKSDETANFKEGLTAIKEGLVGYSRKSSKYIKTYNTNRSRMLKGIANVTKTFCFVGK